MINKGTARLGLIAPIAGLLCAAILAGPTSAQETIKLTIAAAQAPVLIWVKHLHNTFIPTVDAELAKAGKYKIAWNEVYGGTLAKVGSELETMQRGISDIGIVSTIFHSAKMPLNNVTFFVPYGPTDIRVVNEAIDEVQKLPELVGEWKKYGIFYLAGYSFDSYGMTSTFPISKLEDLKGKKIGAAGANLAWLKGTGAVGVQTSLNEAYNSVKTGVYDGNVIFITAAVPTKLYEVAPYFNELKMGAMFGGALAINQSRWNRLPEEAKAAFRKGAAAYKEAVINEEATRVAAATKTWKEHGTVAQFPKSEILRFVEAIPNPTVEWIKQAGNPAKKVLSAYMNAVRKAGFTFPRNFDKE